jgi:ribosomal protein S27E
MRTVLGKPNALGHSAECPECKSLALVTGPPTEIKCLICGTTYRVMWHRYGDPIICIVTS